MVEYNLRNDYIVKYFFRVKFNFKKINFDTTTGKVNDIFLKIRMLTRGDVGDEKS